MVDKGFQKQYKFTINQNMTVSKFTHHGLATKNDFDQFLQKSSLKFGNIICSVTFEADVTCIAFSNVFEYFRISLQNTF